MRVGGILHGATENISLPQNLQVLWERAIRNECIYFTIL